MQKIAIHMVDGQKSETRVNYEVTQRKKIMLDKLEGDGQARGSAAKARRFCGHVTGDTFLMHQHSLSSLTIVSGAMVRCLMNPIFRVKRSLDATKSELSQPISGVRKRMSLIEPLYSFCKAGVLHTELIQAHCKRSTGAST